MSRFTQRGALLLLLVLGSALLFVACQGEAAPPATVIEIKANEFAFEPATISLTKGQRVQLRIRNTGTQSHDFSSDVAASGVSEQGGGGHAGHTQVSKLHVVVDPGQTATLTFTPTTSGTFPVWCSVSGHRESGMVAQLGVQ
jgi:uncharacterized cupredoxin-like copper-binding protein